MQSKLHAFAGAIALLCISMFWVSTGVSELFLGHASVAIVKNAILAAMWLLIPALAATGVSGFVLGKGRGGRLLQAKKRRMKIIAAKDALHKSPRRVHLRTRAVCGVANPRHSYGYGCGLRLAAHPDPQRPLAARLMQSIPNGLLVLLPSAYALASMANAGRFDGLFYAVQALELAAGAINITLLALNMRDGVRLRVYRPE
jgi:hypothetical protein